MANFQYNSVYSTYAIAVISVFLAYGILFGAANEDTIYANTDPQQVEVNHGDQPMFRFEKQNERWLMTEPYIAPALTSRVQLLVDSNEQSDRSYHHSALPVATLFKDPLHLLIDGDRFTVGSKEPVSQLRYVAAGDKVFLQADHIVPLLSAGDRAFIDLKVTGNVKSVKVDGKELKADAWTNLQAIGITDTRDLRSDAGTPVTLKAKGRWSATHYLYFHLADRGILAPQSAAYGYVLSVQQLQQLGLKEVGSLTENLQRL